MNDEITKKMYLYNNTDILLQDYGNYLIVPNSDPF